MDRASMMVTVHNSPRGTPAALAFQLEDADLALLKLIYEVTLTTSLPLAPHDYKRAEALHARGLLDAKVNLTKHCAGLVGYTVSPAGCDAYNAALAARGNVQ